MLATIPSATLLGVDGVPVSVEVHVAGGLPCFTVVGLPDASCREARDRVRAALLTSGFSWPDKRTTVNLAPTSIRKIGSALDLAIAVGVLVASGQVPAEAVGERAFVGELGLDGTLRHVPGGLSLVDALDATEVVVPPGSVFEAELVGRHRILCAPDLRRMVEALKAEAPWPSPPDPPVEPPAPAAPDLAEVRGHPVARTALEVAAAGGHHLLMVGPPGAGKTMLAQRLPGLLPDLDDPQALDATRVHSAAGLPLPGGLVRRPPLRAPHHGTSAVAMIGGGSGRLRPGEISLAHGGVAPCYQNGYTRSPRYRRRPVGTRAAIYARISKDRTGNALGVERQRADCEALCAARGWEVAQVYTDNDLSAYSGKRRPSYEQLLGALDGGDIDAVVAWHPDRLHRSPVELEAFIDLIERSGATVATVQGGDYDLSTAAGRMTARVVGAVARHESEHRSERNQAKALQLARSGQVGGGGTRPFGYAADRVTVVPAELVIIRELTGRVIAGESLRGLVVDLNRRGITTPTGRPWNQTTMRRMLLSPRIAGLRQHRGTIIGEACWPGIIDRADHERLVAILANPGRRTNREPTRYLLTGLAACGLCGSRLVARPRQDRRRCYVCAAGPGFQGCGRIRVLADPLEDLVGGWVVAAMEGIDLDASTVSTPDEAAVVVEIVDVEARVEALAEAWADGEVDRRAWLAAHRRLEDRLDTLRSSLVPAPRLPHDAALGDLAADWPTLEFDQRRTIVRGLVDNVTVGPAGQRPQPLRPRPGHHQLPLVMLTPTAGLAHRE